MEQEKIPEKTGSAKGWDNLIPLYGKKVLEEIQRTNAETTKRVLIEQAPNYYPNLSALARACNISRSLITYYMNEDKEFALAMEENFKKHLDEIENNLLNAAKKEQYASSAGVFVLKSQHPRYKEEKPNILANIQINIGDKAVGNPYSDASDAEIVDDDPSK